MRNQLLRDSDVMSMASGVELRVPFIDVELFDTLSRIPRRPAAAAGKALLLAGRARDAGVGRRPAEARFHVPDGALARARVGRHVSRAPIAPSAVPIGHLVSQMVACSRSSSGCNG